LTFFRSKGKKGGKRSTKGKKIVVLPMTEPTTTTNTVSQQSLVAASSPTKIDVPAPISTGSFGLVDEQEISDSEPIENFFSRSATSLKKKNFKETEQFSSQTYTTTVQTVPPSPPTEQSLVLTQPEKSAEELAHLQAQSKRLSDILTQYLGENYLSQIQDVDINLIEKGNLIDFFFTFKVHGEKLGKMVFRKSFLPLNHMELYRTVSGIL